MRESHQTATLLEQGYASIEAGRAEAALAAFQAAQALLPRAVLPRVAVADLRFSQGRFSEAEAVLRQALEIDPKSALARGRLGELLLFTGRIDQGVQSLRLARAADPGGPAGAHAEAVIQAWRARVFETVPPR